MSLHKPSLRTLSVYTLLGIMWLFSGRANAVSYVVTKTDNAGTGTLRAAVASANTDGVDSDITFDAAVFSTLKTITLATELGLGVNGKLTITGPAAGVRISGNNVCRVFRVPDGADVTLNGLTIMWGRSDFGAGIQNSGTLSINNCTITLNVGADYGGGVFNQGNMALRNCTLSGNSATTSGGGINSGAIVSNGRTALSVANCAFLNNTSAEDGAGMYIRYGTSTTVTNSTFVQNVASEQGGGVYSDGGVDMTNCTFMTNFANSGQTGGGVYGSFASTVNLTNCLGAQNSIDNFGGYINDFGGNVQTATVQQAGLDNAPKNNGGPTQTVALITKGAAVNAGYTAPEGMVYDQRGEGYSRVVGGRVDSGAYESNFAVALENNTGLTVPVGGTKTITDAMLRATDNNGDPVTYEITFGPNHGLVKRDGSWATSFTQADIIAGRISYAQNGSLANNDSFTFNALDGKGGYVTGTFSITITEMPSLVVTTTADTVVTDGQTSLREAIAHANSNPDVSAISFDIPANQKIGGVWTIRVESTLEITQAATITGPGASLLTVRESGSNKILTVLGLEANTTVSGLTISDSGGGIVVQNTGNLTLNNTLLTGNDGALINYGTAQVTNSTVSGNASPGLLNNGGATATLTNCTLANNSQGLVNSGTLTVTNCTFGSNTGNGIYSTGTTTISSSTINGNKEWGFINNGGSPAKLSNCTVSNNGLGVLNSSSLTVTMTNCTLAGNTNIGLLNLGTAEVSNSLIVGSAQNLNGSITSGGNNITSGTAASAGLDPSGLQSNGGPTQTIALLATSPAINAGNDAVAPAKDQRGIARPQGAGSDIGAYEYVAPTGGDTVAPTVTVVKPSNSEVIR